jgi:hypothetical protein
MPVHERKPMTYLKLSSHRLGLLVNFNVDLIRHGITASLTKATVR